MKSIIIVILLAVSITANAQCNYNVGDTIKVDNDLTLIVTGSRYAWIMDVLTQDLKYKKNDKISDYDVGIVNASGFTPPLSSEIAKDMIEIFREVFTEQELDYLSKSKNRYGGSNNISFNFWVNLDNDIVSLAILFSLEEPDLCSIPTKKMGHLYRLMCDGIKFNMRDTGFGGIHHVDLTVEFKDVVNGTLDYSHLMRDINKGGYLNYYWKDGKVHSFE